LGLPGIYSATFGLASIFSGNPFGTAPWAKGRFAGLLAGGLDQDGTLLHGPVEAIQREVRDAIAQTGGRRLLVAPGCVAPIATPDAHYRAVVEAATGMLP